MRRARVPIVGLLAIAGVSSPAAVARPLEPGTTTLVSVATNGREANGWSFQPAMSANGRFVAWSSSASILVGDDANAGDDVFVRDLRAGVTRLVGVADDGSQPNNGTFGPTLSRSGRYVAFDSAASNLVPGDTNDDWDVFVRDMRRGVLQRVNVAADGAQADGSSGPSAISPDGQSVAFMSDAPNLVAGDTNSGWDVFVRDLRTNRTRLVSVADDGGPGNGFSLDPAVSRHGRRVAFVSAASNLVAGDTDGFDDVFVRDLRTRRTRPVSVAADGGPANGVSGDASISADGRYVAFTSAASNLVVGDTNNGFDMFVRDLRSGVTRLASVLEDG